jgi:hypothetical protein
MSLISGTARNGTWRTSVTTGTGWDQGDMPYYVVANDARGNSRQLPASTPHPIVKVQACIL